jgi:hypothetical protein
MPTPSPRSLAARILLVSLVLPTPALFAWGSKGHQIINAIAISKLPSDVPKFLTAPAAVNEITWLGPEPDRWRSPMEPELNAAQAPEHFIDLEIAEMPGPLPHRRFDYIASLYAAGLNHPDMARDLRPERAGLLPYEAVEVFERLQAALRSYRESLAQNKDTAPAEQAAIFYAGWLGHYVGDGSQPLHVTVNYNGWTQKDNPHNYANDHKIHARFETVFVDRNIERANIEPLITQVRILDHPFDDFVAYLHQTQSYMDKVYALDQQNGFNGAGTEESRKFTAERIAAGASMLRDMIDTAWVDSAKPLPADRD